MNIVFYKYGSICEPDLENAFMRCGLEVNLIDREVNDKRITGRERVKLVSEAIDSENPIFVFSIDYFPDIARICRIYSLRYVSYVVDSPLPELFSDTIGFDTTKVFLFDRSQYETFHKYNPNGIFNLPLATDPDRWSEVIQRSGHNDMHDVSFVGSLYSEKNRYDGIRSKLSEKTRGYVQGLVNALMCLPGCSFTEEALSDEIVWEIKDADPNGFVTDSMPKDICGSRDARERLLPESKDAVGQHDLEQQSIVNRIDRYIASEQYIGFEEAVCERRKTLSILSEWFDTALYTRSDTSDIRKAAPGLHIYDGVKTLTEMPLVFAGSRINMNITVKPIKSGLSLRVFDICGCGGFLMTNYQAELPEYFDIGTEAECYSSTEELREKIAFYLSNEDARERIAAAGLVRVRSEHTWTQRVARIIKKVSE